MEPTKLGLGNHGETRACRDCRPLTPQTQRFASIAPANEEDEAELALSFSKMAPLPTCHTLGLPGDLSDQLSPVASLNSILAALMVGQAA